MRFRKTIGAVAILIPTTVLGVVGGSVVYLRSDAGNSYIADEIRTAAAEALPFGQFEIEGLKTDLFSSWEINGIHIQDRDGTDLLKLKKLELHYNLSRLASSSIDDITIDVYGPEIDIAANEEGELRWNTLFEPSTEEGTSTSEPFEGLGIDISLAHFRVHDAQLKDGDAPVLSDLSVDINSHISEAGNIDIGIENIQMDIPDVGKVKLNSALTINGALLTLKKSTLSLDDLRLDLKGQVASIYTNPALALNLDTTLKVNALEPFTQAPIPAVETPIHINLIGALSDLKISTQVQNLAGDLGIDALLNLESEPLKWDLTIKSEAFKISDIVPNYIDQETTIAGRYRVYGGGTEWPEGIDATVEFVAPKQRLYGYDMEAIQIDGKLKSGVFTVEGLSLKHSAAELALMGKADFKAEKAELEVRALVPDMAKLAEFGVNDIRGYTRISGPLKVKWGEVIDAEYKGDLELRNIKHPSASVRYGVGKIGVKYNDEGVVYRGDLDLDTIDAAGTTIAKIKTDFNGDMKPDNAFELHAGLSVNEILVGDGAVQLNDITGGIDLFSSDKGMRLDTRGLELSTLELQPAGYVIDGGPLNLSLDGENLIAELILKRKGTEFVNVLAKGGLESGIWNLERFSFMPTEADPWATTEAVQLELKDDGVGAFAIFLEGNKGKIQLKNDIINGEPSLFLGVDDLDIAYIEEVGALLTGSEVLPKGSIGSISAKLSLTGDDGRFGSDDYIEIKNLTLPEILEQVNFKLNISESLVYPKIQLDLTDRLARPLSSLSVQWPIDNINYVSRCEDEALVRLQLYPNPLYRYRESIPQIPELDGMISASFDLSGSPCTPEMRLSSAFSLPVGVYEQRVRVDSLIEVDGTGVEIDAALSQDLREQLYIKGHLQSDLYKHIEPIFSKFTPPSEDEDPLLWFDDINLDLIFDDLSIEDTLSLVDAPKGLKGRIVGGISIHGPPSDPIVSGGGAILNGRIGHTRISSANISFESDVKHLVFDGNMNFGDFGQAILKADIPKSDEGTMMLMTKGVQIPLDGALGLVTGVENADGFLNWGLSYSELEPEATQFQAGITGGSLDYTPIGINVSELELKIESTPEQILLNYLKGTTSPIGSSNKHAGTFNTSGIIDLKDQAPVDGKIHFKADKLWLHHTRLAKMALSGSAKLHYRPDAISVNGDFNVDEGQVNLDERFFVQDATLALHPNMKIFRSGMAEPKVVIEEKEKETSSVEADISIALNRKVRIQAAMPMLSSYGASFAKLSTVNVDTLLDGDLNIQYSNDTTEVIGDVLTPKGSIEMLGSTFLIDGGEVNFVGTDYANPELKMKATKRMPKYGDIDITLSGLVSNMTPVFSEESGQYDDTDLMSLILFGKPVSELTESEGEGSSALLSTALSSVTSSLGGSLGQALGGNVVDEVELNPTEGSFRIGKSLSEKLYLVYQKNMQAQEGENFNEFSLEWLIQSRLYAEFIAGDAMVSSADIYYRWIF